MLKHVRECAWDEYTSAAVAGGGHFEEFEILKWARANGCLWCVQTCIAAAEGGHLEILGWLRGNAYGCPWDEYKCGCRRAAYGGHLEVLKWLRATGCPWDEHAHM